jgi:hypothetical protein
VKLPGLVAIWPLKLTVLVSRCGMLQLIVFSMCLLSQPTQCKEVYIQIASEFGRSLQAPYNCLRQGQIEGQKWIERHPEWRIERWKCPPAQRLEANL